MKIKSIIKPILVIGGIVGVAYLIQRCSPELPSEKKQDFMVRIHEDVKFNPGKPIIEYTTERTRINTNITDVESYKVSPNDKELNERIIPGISNYLSGISNYKYNGKSIKMPFDTSFRTNNLDNIVARSAIGRSTWTFTVDDKWVVSYNELDNSSPSSSGYVSYIGAKGADSANEHWTTHNTNALARMAAEVPKKEERLDWNTVSNLVTGAMASVQNVGDAKGKKYLPTQFSPVIIYGHNIGVYSAERLEDSPELRTGQASNPRQVMQVRLNEPNTASLFLYNLKLSEN